MNTLQLLFTVVGFSLISWSSSEGIESRQYLPAAAAPLAQRKLLLFPSYYKPFYNQYQQTYYPQYTSSYHPQYNNGIIGGYQQQALGQQISTGTSLAPQITSGTALGGYQQQALGSQISSGTSVGGGYQKPALETQISSGTSLDLTGLGLIGYYPNLNLDLVTSLKPQINVLETIPDTISGNYVYGKKK